MNRFDTYSNEERMQQSLIDDAEIDAQLALARTGPSPANWDNRRRAAWDRAMDADELREKVEV